jgi:hypothetical protein
MLVTPTAVPTHLLVFFLWSEGRHDTFILPNPLKKGKEDKRSRRSTQLPLTLFIRLNPSKLIDDP